MTNRYRMIDEDPNSQCDMCGDRIWVRIASYAIRHGGGHYWEDSRSEVCSFATLVEFNGVWKSGNVCPDCWGKHYG